MDKHAAEEVFSQAAAWCADVVASVPGTEWNKPGLGEWDLRALVGHTGRALSTVVRAIATPAAAIELETAEDYFLATTERSKAAPNAVRDRGVAAGKEMGEHPAHHFQTLLSDALAATAAVGDPLVTSVAGGMRLSQYLRTRVFELVVHGLDIQSAIATIPATDLAPPPTVALHETLTIAQNLVVSRGDGARWVFALTGRGSLPSGYSVLG